MAESITISRALDRASEYRELAPQIEALIAGESNLIASLANVAAALKQAFDFFWVGFYLASDGQLILGPFQGPVACARIEFGQGVCGHVFNSQKTEIVPDVDLFPGHIACSTASKSEIVVPIFDSAGNIRGVLDVDSAERDSFGEADKDGLQAIVKLLGDKF